MTINPTIVKIEAEIFTPAMQLAMKHAQDAGHSVADSLMGATNAHLNMLVELLGSAKAQEVLRNQVSFLVGHLGVD